MNAWKVILATLVIFLAGVVTGGLVIRNSPELLGLPRHHIGGSEGGMRFEFLRRVQRDLNLTPAQREQIEKALKEGQERTRKLMQPIAAGMRDELHRTKEEFRAVLNSEQRARFDELIKRQQHPREPHRSAAPREAKSATNTPAAN